MKATSLSLAFLSVTALFNTANAHAQTATPMGCFQFSDEAQTRLVGYKKKHRSQACPKNVEIPGSVTQIGADAFAHSGLDSVLIPGSVTRIGNRAFFYNSLSRVEIPDSVTTIGDGAFAINRLRSVEIPNSVTEIGIQAFKENKLSSVVIPDSVTRIGAWAFQGNCLDLDEVRMPTGATRGRDIFDDQGDLEHCGR
jgi:hypothetical protein